MYLPRKPTGIVIIAILLAFTTYVGATRPYFDDAVYFFYMVALFIAVMVINWVGSEPKQDEKSQRKVEKLLRELDDADLDLLRSRLMRDDPEVDYGSMAELVQSGKRKNEVR